jgi:hypothetical protein
MRWCYNSELLRKVALMLYLVVKTELGVDFAPVGPSWDPAGNTTTSLRACTLKDGPDKIGPRAVSPLHRRSQQPCAVVDRTSTGTVSRRETKFPRNHVRRQLDYRQGWIDQMHTADSCCCVAVTFRDAGLFDERLHGEFQTVVQRTVLFEQSVRLWNSKGSRT